MQTDGRTFRRVHIWFWETFKLQKATVTFPKEVQVLRGKSVHLFAKASCEALLFEFNKIILAQQVLFNSSFWTEEKSATNWNQFGAWTLAAFSRRFPLPKHADGQAGDRQSFASCVQNGRLVSKKLPSSNRLYKYFNIFKIVIILKR